ncbi:MAG: HDOD domain-containing protein [Sulfurospirillaceae bacterium]|nr:HDOD domain-containing protein [Sulfurospirillaceae bacterium]MDD2827279.1 HDOD domain-containing protein [Sulfurospirillaceae bacterium]
MLDQIAERIKTLPPLPKSFHQISLICNNENASVSDLASIIEEDPMLVANLLKVANSPLYSFRREIKSVLQAVSLFGMSTTRSLVMDMSIKKLLNVDMAPYGITPDEFAHISSLQGSLIMHWYKKMDASKIEMLFLAALMQETGKILIADEIVKNDETYQFKSEIENSTNVANVEKIFVGTTSAEVTARIFEHWKFDDFMVQAIRYSDNLENVPEAIRPYSLALKIVKAAIPINSPLSERSIALAQNIVIKENLNEEIFLSALDKVLEHF